jgi:uncharacterized protein YndB with AHSA1/START domain
MEGQPMDLYATLPRPVQATFGRVADPARLADWLPQVQATASGRGVPPGLGTEFRATMQIDGLQVTATGEMVAYEPPWLVGYRMLAEGRTVSLRITCAAQPGGTGIHVHQPDGTTPLTVDLARLNWALAVSQPRPGTSPGGE